MSIIEVKTGEVFIRDKKKFILYENHYMFDNDTWNIIKKYMGIIDFYRLNDLKSYVFDFHRKHSSKFSPDRRDSVLRFTDKKIFLISFEISMFNKLKYYLNQRVFKSVLIAYNCFEKITYCKKSIDYDNCHNMKLSELLKIIYFNIRIAIFRCRKSYKKYFQMPYRIVKED